jgi:hypothetical protein
MSNRSLILVILATVSGCSTQAGNDGGAKSEPRDVAGLASALFANCSDDAARFLNNHTFYVATATTEAYGNYAPDSALALKYFGEGHDSDRARSTLEQIINVAYSDQLNFSCDPIDQDDGTDCSQPTTVLWSLDSAWRTGDWTIHVCGDRIMDQQYVNGVDEGDGASSTGILVHEIAHLAGAWWEEGYGEQVVLDSAQNVPYLTTLYGETYRFYVMNQDR